MDRTILVIVVVAVLLLLVWPALADTTCTTNWYCDDWGNCSAVTDCYDY